jgi:hypothetical protein
MDDNYDTYKTANIEINQLFFERLIKYFFFELHLSCGIYIFDRVRQNSLSLSAPVKSFIHVSVHSV